MAITSVQQTEILKIVAGLFNAAPGTDFLPDMESFIEGGGDPRDLAGILASHTTFTNGVLGAATDIAGKVEILMGNFGLEPGGSAGSASAIAEEYFTDRITAGDDFGDIIYDAVTYLSGSVPPEFTEVATLLSNKAKTAAVFSKVLGGTDLADLQNVLSEVTGDETYDDDDVIAALERAGVDLNPGDTFTLTSTAEVKLLTDKNDTVDGSLANSLEGDTVIDQGGKDTLNAKLTAALTSATTIADVENVNLDWDAFGTAVIDAAKITNAAITVSSTKLGYLGNVQIDNAGANKVVAGAGAIGTLDVNGATTAVVDGGQAKTVTVDAAASKGVSSTVTAGANTTTVTVGAAGAANAFATNNVTGGAATTAINIHGTTGTADVANVSVVKDGTVSLLTNKVETVNLTAGADQKVTIGDASLFDALKVTSAGAVTLIAGSDELTTKTLTNSTTGLTINLTSDAAADLSKVQFSTLNLTNGLAGGDLTVASGAMLRADVALATNEILATTDTGDIVTVLVTVDQTLIDVLDGTNDVEALNLSTALAGTDADSILTVAQVDAKNLVVAGADKVTLTLFNAESVDASKVTKDFTATQGTAAKTTVVGSSTAKNTVTFTATTQEVSYTGGEGNDTVTMAQTTGNSTVVLGNGTNTYTNTTLTDGVAVILGGVGVDTITVTATDSGANTANITIQSGDGNDVIALSLAGAKEIAAVDLGKGDDKLTLGSNTSATDELTVAGGDGNDTIDLNGKNISAGTINFTAIEFLHDSTGAAVVDGSLLTDKTFTIQGDGNKATQLDVGIATAGSYNFSGLVIDQTLSKGLGGLSITGNAGNDTIIGTSGSDNITSGGGTDKITGGGGVDAMTAGGGTDTFTFAAGDSGTTTTTADSITSFTSTADKLSFGVAAGSASNYVENLTDAADMAAAKTNADTAMDGTVRYFFQDDGTDGYLFVDMDGDGTADLGVKLLGVTDMALGDIIG
ncbi:MAG: hypothetical protein LZF61_03055 [Nitrosomonas sp.]|nr:MAG: hypothetical protein LZF61_03055 [Nitrosomonas sp.]